MRFREIVAAGTLLTTKGSGQASSKAKVLALVGDRYHNPDYIRVGMTKVKVEAFAHNSANPDGRWAVQTGPFKSEGGSPLEASAAKQRGSRPAGVWGATVV